MPRQQLAGAVIGVVVTARIAALEAAVHFLAGRQEPKSTDVLTVAASSRSG